MNMRIICSKVNWSVCAKTFLSLHYESRVSRLAADKINNEFEYSILVYMDNYIQGSWKNWILNQWMGGGSRIKKKSRTTVKVTFFKCDVLIVRVRFVSAEEVMFVFADKKKEKEIKEIVYITSANIGSSQTFAKKRSQTWLRVLRVVVGKWYS